MRGGNRNRALQVRVARHHRGLQLSGTIDDDLLQLTNRRIDPLARVHGPQPGRRGDLIVPAASRVEFRRDVANLFMQQAIDERVHVLVAGQRRLAAVQAIRDGIEPSLERLALVERKDTRAP